MTSTPPTLPSYYQYVGEVQDFVEKLKRFTSLKFAKQMITVSDDTTPESTTTSNAERKILVIYYKNKFYGIEGMCPHQQAPLSYGDIEDIESLGDPKLICPRHGWKIDMLSGSVDQNGDSVDIYDVQVVEGKVYVDVRQKKNVK